MDGSDERSQTARSESGGGQGFPGHPPGAGASKRGDGRI